MDKSNAFQIELKGMDSVDLPAMGQEPSDPANCCIETNLSIGIVGAAGSNNFKLYFVTPAWLMEHLSIGEFRLLEYTVVIARFEWQLAERAARGLLAATEAWSWEEFVEEFGRIAYWEYSLRPLPGESRDPM